MAVRRPTRKKKVRRKKAKKVNRVFELTQEEKELLNRATAMLTLAKLNMTSTWKPIRKRYNLPDTAYYQRDTGKVIING